MTPPIVTAISTYLFFSLGFVNSVFWLACAHTVCGLPFVVINVAASLRSADKSRARRGDPWRTAALGDHAHHAADHLARYRGWRDLRLRAFAHELMVAIFVLGGVGSRIGQDVVGRAGQSDPTIAAVSTLLIGVAVFTFASVTLTQLTKRRTT